jgi:hypothetical protein
MGAWDTGLYGSDDALDARAELLRKVTLPEEPRLFAACVGLLALLDPTADQFDAIASHSALSALPQGLREAATVAASVHASGPRLPYTAQLGDILGIDASYGRVVDPLLQLRESITIGRALRDRCVRAVDESFSYGETAAGGLVGVLLELRELGIATSPDVVDEWLDNFDRVRAIGDRDETEYIREWSRSYRMALELLAIPPHQKLIGSDPTTTGRTKRVR